MILRYNEYINENLITDKIKNIGEKIAKNIKTIFTELEQDENIEEITNGIDENKVLKAKEELESKGLDINKGVVGNWEKLKEIAKQTEGTNESISFTLNESLSDSISKLLIRCGFSSVVASLGSILYAKYGMSTVGQMWGATSFTNISFSTLNITVMGLTIQSWIIVLCLGLLLGTIGFFWRKRQKNNIQ